MTEWLMKREEIEQEQHYHEMVVLMCHAFDLFEKEEKLQELHFDCKQFELTLTNPLGKNVKRVRYVFYIYFN